MLCLSLLLTPKEYLSHSFFFLMIGPPRKSTLFPYTTLFRSELTLLLKLLMAECVTDVSRKCVLQADPAVRAGIAGSTADRGAEIVADDDADNTTTAGEAGRSEEHTSELQSQSNLVCRLLLEK